MQSKRVPRTMHPHFLQGSLSPTGNNYRNMRGLLLLTLGQSQGFHNEYGAGFIHSVDFVTYAFIHSPLHSVPKWLSVSQFHLDTLSFSLTSFPPYRTLFAILLSKQWLCKQIGPVTLWFITLQWIVYNETEGSNPLGCSPSFMA